MVYIKHIRIEELQAVGRISRYRARWWENSNGTWFEQVFPSRILKEQAQVDIGRYVDAKQAKVITT